MGLTGSEREAIVDDLIERMAKGDKSPSSSA